VANGSGQKFIARGYHTTGADLCTTSSKKHELNLSKARSAGAFSYVAFGTFVGFNPIRWYEMCKAKEHLGTFSRAAAIVAAGEKPMGEGRAVA
jgi:hypothetical protein